VYDAGILPGGHRPIKASVMYLGGSNPEPVRLKNRTRATSMAKAIHTFFIYLYRRKKTAVVLRRELEGLGRRSHHQTLGPTRVADDRGVNGRDGTHVGIGRNTHERRLNTLGKAIEAPPGPRTVHWRRNVPHRARRLGTRRRTGTVPDKEEDDDKC